MRAHLLSAERAIQSYTKQIEVRYGNEKRFHRLSAEGSSAGIGDGAGNHDGQLHAFFSLKTVSMAKRAAFALSVSKMVSTSSFGTAVDEAAGLHRVRFDQVVKAHGPEAGIIHIRRERRSLVGRPERAGNETRRAVWMVRRETGYGFFREASGGEVDLVRKVLHVVIGQGEGLRVKGVGS